MSSLKMILEQRLLEWLLCGKSAVFRRQSEEVEMFCSQSSKATLTQVSECGVSECECHDGAYIFVGS